MSKRVEVLREIVADLIKDTLDDSIDHNPTLAEIQYVDWGVYLTGQGIDLNLIDETALISLIAGVAYTVDRLYEE